MLPILLVVGVSDLKIEPLIVGKCAVAIGPCESADREAIVVIVESFS